MSDEGRRRRHLSADERKLWHQVAKTLTPLPGRSLPAVPTETPPPVAAAPPKKTASASAALRPPAPRLPALAPLERRTRQKLVRGKVDIDARTDLHGLTQDQAYDRLRRFLATAQVLEHKLVLVITGKGQGDGVLRRMVPMWLGRPDLRGLVVGFEEAHAGHGGSGALYVRIRRNKGGRR